MYVCEIKALVLKLDIILIHGIPLFSYQCEMNHLQDNFFHSILHHDVSEYKLLQILDNHQATSINYEPSVSSPPPYILSQCLYKTVPDWHVEINYLKLQYYYRCICHILYLIAFRNVGSAVCQTTYWTHLHGVPQLVFRDWHNVGTTSFL